GARGATGAQRWAPAAASDASRCNDGCQTRHGWDAAFKIAPAGGDLRGSPLVLRRHAPHGIGAHAIHELKPVIWRRTIRSPREPKFKKRLVKELAGIVAGERPARPVCPSQTRRQPHYEEASCRIAE